MKALYIIAVIFLFVKIEPKPYNFDKKPIPAGRDWAKILPKKVGTFNQAKFQLFERNKCGVGAEYSSSGKVISVSGTIRGEDNSACNDSMYSPSLCGENKSGSDYNLEICDGYASIRYFRGPNSKFMFEISAKSKKDLDEFMNAFPY